jgi:uncharacterized repeat protein (TIGR02543 family)
LEPPNKEEHIFDGWYIDLNYSIGINSISSGSVGDLVVYAKWIAFYKVNFIITTDGINPAKDVDIIINNEQKLQSDISGLADTIFLDGSYFEYTIEIEGIVIDSGSVSVSGSDVTINIEIVDCFVRWYDVIFCDNGKGLWTDFEWYKENSKISDEQFFHNSGGIENGKYKLKLTSINGIVYTWEKEFNSNTFWGNEFKTNNFRENGSTSEISELIAFPIPVLKNNNLNIHTPDNINLQNSKILIYDIKGKLIKTINNPLHINEVYIDNNFSTGKYQLILIDDKNNRNAIVNFIVH